jgi:pheromone shutdown protein TraB
VEFDEMSSPSHLQELTEEELRRRNARSRALGWFLGALVILFFVVTIAKLGGNVMNRPI